MAKAPSARLYYLDALRAFAILFGILVHVATTGIPYGVGWIGPVSGYFRMGLFFLVSGYFTAMMLRRYPAGDFIRRRSVALLVPLATGLVLLNPVTNWLVINYHNAPPMSLLDSLPLPWGPRPPGMRGPFIWHLHLWFLISLFFYAVTAPLMLALARRVRPAGRMAERVAAGWPAVAAILLVALAVALGSVGLRVAYEIALAPLLDRTHAVWIGPTTMYYWPFFLFGMAFFAHPALMALFQRLSLPALAVGIAVGWGALQIDLAGPAGEVVRTFGKAFCTTTVIALLMGLFARHLNRPTWLSGVADYVYSIYIMHFLVIYLAAFALRPLDLAPLANFAAIAAITFAAVFAFHRLVVQPVPLLQLLLNGKPMPRRAARAVAAEGAPGRGD